MWGAYRACACDERGDEGASHEDVDEDRERLVEEPADLAVGQVERLSHLGLHQRPDDDAEDQRQDRDPEAAYGEAHGPEDEQQRDVEGALLVDRVGAEEAKKRMPA